MAKKKNDSKSSNGNSSAIAKNLGAVTNDLTVLPPEGQLLIYQDGALRVQVRMDGQTVWLTQAAIAELYQTTSQNITMHLKGIYLDGELNEGSTCKEFLQVRREGARDVQRKIKHYNLEAILAVGYRVRSGRGTAFRQWATARLSELLVKVFTMDDERLKAGQTLGDDYFDELLERIRDIRASERMFYQKITDIYATSIDYDPRSDITQTFFATVQNKLHWAIHGHTAAEVIHQRADASSQNMGLATWKNAPHGPIRRTDVTVAKNYLTEKEISELNRIVTMYLDYAEDQARRRKPMYMSDWAKKLDAFLEFNERDILTHAGKISPKMAEEHASKEFEQYEAKRRRLEASTPTSDFDRFVEQSKKLEGRQKKDLSEGAKAKRAK
ncbi:MAG: virulence RhuM family protein [Synergistales bacterium]|nr:virulence RhuM family protein [Synergistales bacterium]